MERAQADLTTAPPSGEVGVAGRGATNPARLPHMPDGDIILGELMELVRNKKVLKDAQRSFVSDDEHLGDDVFKNAATTLAEIEQRLGRQWRHCAQRLAAVAKTLLPFAGDKEGENPVMAISCDTQLLWRALERAGAGRHIKQRQESFRTLLARLIRRARAVGLLVCIDEVFHFVENGQGDCRKYVLNRPLAQLLVAEFCPSSSIASEEGDAAFLESPLGDTHETSWKGRVNLGEVLDRVLEEEAQGWHPQAAAKQLEKVRFSSNLYLPSTCAHEDVVRALLRRYPALERYRRLALSLNDRYYAKYPMLQMGFAPIITVKGKFIRSIGIRAYSRACNLPKNAKAGFVSREELLKQYFGPGPERPHYDVPSSIFRVAYFLKKGEWLNDDIDLYQKMSPITFSDKFPRNSFKTLAMFLYFGGTHKQVAASLRRRLSELRERYSQKDVAELIQMLQASMFSTVGESLGGEIFFHESCIYLDLHKFLTDQGLKVVQVYDAFYSDAPRLPELCKEALPQIAAAYAERWLRPSHEGGVARG